MAVEEDLTPTEFLISKMEGMDDVTQILIVTRKTGGEINYDTCGQVCSDTLGMLAFVQVAVKEYLRRELYDIADGDD